MTYHEVFKAQIIFRLEEKQAHLLKCIDQLKEEEMWWRPNESSNSVGNILLHLCGNISQYILSSLGQQPDIRERDAEFAARAGYDKAALWKKMANTIEEACRVVTATSQEEMLRERMVQGFQFSGVGVALHAVEHLSYHTGQVAYLVKLLKDRQIGLYDDFDLNLKNEAN
jgi:uncharacterized damage-inducible protein DinB